MQKIFLNILVGLCLVIGILLFIATLFALLDPVGTQLADDADPFGAPPSPLSAWLLLMLAVSLITAPIVFWYRQNKY